MKQIKQKRVLACLASGKYKVVNDKVLRFDKGKDQWLELKDNLLPSGYKQHTLFNSRRGKDGIKEMVYKHIVIYLANYGEYPEGWQVDHKDRDNSNNMPDNLEAKPAIDNIANSAKTRVLSGTGLRTIRAQEIRDIKELMTKGLSQAAIARKLDLNRLSVRYTIKQIEKNLPLKYQ